MQDISLLGERDSATALQPDEEPVPASGDEGGGSLSAEEVAPEPEPEESADADAAAAAEEGGSAWESERRELERQARAAIAAQQAADRRYAALEKKFESLTAALKRTTEAENIRKARDLALSDPEAFAQDFVERTAKTEEMERLREEIAGELLQSYALSALDSARAALGIDSLSADERREAYQAAVQTALLSGSVDETGAVIPTWDQVLAEEYKLYQNAKGVSEARIKALEEQLKAAMEENASYRLRLNIGSGEPAGGGASTGLTPEQIAAMSDDEYESRRDEILRWEAQRLRSQGG